MRSKTIRSKRQEAKVSKAGNDSLLHGIIWFSNRASLLWVQLAQELDEVPAAGGGDFHALALQFPPAFKGWKHQSTR